VSGSVSSPPAPSTPEPPAPAERARKGAGRSALTVFGVVLLLAGLGLLGWVGYEYIGTNVVSERAFSEEKAQLRARWSAEGTASGRGDRSSDRTEAGSSSAIPGETMALLRIPAFGDDFEVPILEGTELADLDRGVGHYSSSAQPGQVGNFALAGHRITHGQPFARLLELDRGDAVIVETRDATYTYAIDGPPRDLTVPDSATWVLDPVPGDPKAKSTRALLTLTTCQDLFRSPDRSVGFGHLVSTKTKG
jgi:sortase A